MSKQPNPPELLSLFEKIEQDGLQFGMSEEEIESLKKDCRLAFRYLHLYHKTLLKKLVDQGNKDIGQE